MQSVEGAVSFSFREIIAEQLCGMQGKALLVEQNRISKSRGRCEGKWRLPTQQSEALRVKCDSSYSYVTVTATIY